MLGSTTKKLGQAIPGGWGETPSQEKNDPADSEAQEQGDNLAAGVVGKIGEIVDDAGNTVGKITEGEPGDLVGNVVTATGDIVGKDGGLVGKALPLGEDGKEAGEGAGFNLMGAAKGVKGVIDTADGTVQTVNRSLPIVGDITKGLGLGGESQEGEGSTPKAGSSLLGGVLGSKPEDRDPEEKEKVTEEAKQSLFEVNNKTSEVAPIDLKDQEGDATDAAAAATKTEVDSRSQPPQSDTESNTEFTKQTDTDDQNLTEIKPEDGQILDDAKDKTQQDLPDDVKAEDIAKDVPEEAGEAAEGAKSEAEGAAKSVGGAAESVAEGAKGAVESAAGGAKSQLDDIETIAGDKLTAPFEKYKGAKIDDEGKVMFDNRSIGKIVEGDIADLADKEVDVNGNILNENGSVVGRAELKAELADAALKSQLDEIETIPGDQLELEAPFEKFKGAKVDEEGKIIFDNESIGKVVEGEIADLANKEVDPEGNILNEKGSVVGKAELKTEVAEDLLKEVYDFTVLKGATVNKAGNLVNDKNETIGRVTEGILKQLVGRKADENGEIWNDSGKVIGKAQPIPEKEREEFKKGSPFEDFPNAVVQSNGEVTSDGEIIGRVTEGDPKELKGKKVDEDGDIQDRNGNVIGKAERWEPEPEPEPEPEQPPDNSILAGKRVNKAGNVVDSNGNIFGRVIEGDVKKLAGRMCNKEGQVVSESGDVIGQAEVIPEGDREGFKEGPFAELPGCTVSKEGHVVTPSGDIVGRLTQGDGKTLFGRSVDEDGDVLDRNGNPIGKAERWEPEPEPEKKKGPMAGRRVNKQGEVVDEDGNIIGKLTSGELSICAGKEIDDDGDVVDGKGNTVGHVSLVEDIPEPEPEETAEEKKAREEAEKDEKLAQSLGGLIEQGLDKIRPICKMITDKIDRAERTPKEELDEEELVKTVKPLIEEGGKILNELNGTIRALDPDGRIQRNAKHKSNTREATPAEYHLADVLKELTGTITTCIDNAKNKIEGMPHAKKELNPLWGLLTEPLFQILAAVGLLLTGVLNLVGRLLSGLGLGGIVDGLLGSLGLNRLLDSLGLGSITSALTGKGDKKK